MTFKVTVHFIFYKREVFPVILIVHTASKSLNVKLQILVIYGISY